MAKNKLEEELIAANSEFCAKNRELKAEIEKQTQELSKKDAAILEKDNQLKATLAAAQVWQKKAIFWENAVAGMREAKPSI